MRDPDGSSLDTTMGFTPLEGLVMATRCGSVDPGMLLWLLEREQLLRGGAGRALEHRSGLLGLSGTGDMRELLAAADSGDRRGAARVRGLPPPPARRDRCDGRGPRRPGRARVHRGVGERSAAVRERAADGLGFLGVAIDHERNRTAVARLRDSAADASAATIVIAAREDLEIARQVRAVLGGL